jgi:hypothetical protein
VRTDSAEEADVDMMYGSRSFVIQVLLLSWNALNGLLTLGEVIM